MMKHFTVRVSLISLLFFFHTEYIVGFTDYFAETSRHDFLSDALGSVGVARYEILPHHEKLNQQPSDFDVVRVRDEGRGRGG